VSEEAARPLFDSHCHLTADTFEGEVEVVLQRAREAGLVGIVTIASSASDAVRALEIARAHHDVWSTAGIHPHDVGAATPGDFTTVAELLDQDRVVAVGETGLDYHYDHSPRATQRACLDHHIALAASKQRPIVVHSREAEADTIAAVCAAGSAGVLGVLHCFAGSRDLLEAGLAVGWYVSFAGLVTFKRFEDADLVRAVPADRLLIETDAPYLAPVPRRGRRNEPAFAVYTCTAIAAMRGVAAGDLARTVTRNANRFYGLQQSTATTT
jgi:TatD DNase family protein